MNSPEGDGKIMQKTSVDDKPTMHPARNFCFYDQNCKMSALYCHVVRVSLDNGLHRGLKSGTWKNACDAARRDCSCATGWLAWIG
jgi:hypothetical protein